MASIDRALNGLSRGAKRYGLNRRFLRRWRASKVILREKQGKNFLKKYWHLFSPFEAGTIGKSNENSS